MKRKMKRFLSILLTAALAFTISMPVLATETEGEGTDNTAENTTVFNTVYVSVTGDDQADIYLYQIIKLMDEVDDNKNMITEAYSLEWISEDLKEVVREYNPTTWYSENKKFKYGNLDLTTPALLNSLTNDEADAFYQWLADVIRKDTYIEEGGGEEATGEKYKCIRVKSSSDSATTDGEITSHLFTKVTTGGYLALASGGVNVYQPTSVNLLPVKDGSQITWNNTEPKYFVMKASIPKVEKTVTDGDDAAPAKSATVAAGDPLSFDVYTDVPEYSDDYKVSEIRYTMVDIISSVFTYDSTNPIEISGIKSTDSGTEETVLTSDDYAILATGGKVYINKNTEEILFISTGFSSNNTFYWPNGRIMNSGTLAGAITEYNDANTGNSVISSSDVSASGEKYAIIVDFSGKFDKISDYEKINYHYSVTVTAAVEAGVDSNCNTAKLAYTTDPANASETSSTETTVTVYTFGVDISKIDGTTEAGLDSVEFYLYKKIGTMSKSDYDKLVANGIEDEYQSMAIANTENVTAYERIFADKELITGDITTDGSEETKSGKLLIEGLDVGDYLLVEAAPLAGYNALEEPVTFTITQDVEEPKYVANNTTAFYPVTVENYQGVTLPSTGSLGISIFVIIGVGIAGAAIILMVTQRRKIFR